MYARTWKSAKEPPIVAVVFIHGFGEYINRYDHVFDQFNKAGIEVYAYDQRGFGLTAVKNDNPGVSGGWDVLLGDITPALDLVSQRRKGIPQILYGHSMGGALALEYACKGSKRENVVGYLASSPMLDQAPESKPGLARGLEIFVKGTIPVIKDRVTSIELDPAWMSHDPNEVEKYRNDPFIKGLGSYQHIKDMGTRPQTLINGAYKNITRPVFIVHGTADKVTNQPFSKQFYDKIPSKTEAYDYKPVPDMFHELHNERQPERQQVIQSYIDWILARVKK
jgi:acylglycerol lipase